jgi:hypothetical protein
VSFIRPHVATSDTNFFAPSALLQDGSSSYWELVRTSADPHVRRRRKRGGNPASRPWLDLPRQTFKTGAVFRETAAQRRFQLARRAPATNCRANRCVA